MTLSVWFVLAVIATRVQDTVQIPARSDNEECAEYEFTCTENKSQGRSTCIPRRWVCDGDPDCVDGADEDLELANCTFTPEPSTESHFTCANGRRIPMPWRCDYTDDCGDGSDEGAACEGRYRNCTEDEFACANHRCVLNTYLCDGDDDCRDNSDEVGCAKDVVECAPGKFSCGYKNDNGTHHCIKYELVCNKVDDCSNGADEALLCNQEECAQTSGNQCAPKCIDTPSGQRCQCASGYRLIPDKRSCEYIDECAEQISKCSQQCFNRPGNFSCKCNDEFYQREPDGMTCKRRDDTPGWLIIADKHYNQNISTNGSLYTPVYAQMRDVVALDFDLQESRLYFYDVSDKNIYRTARNESGEFYAPIISQPVSGVEGLSVDWVGRKLYWLDRNEKHLAVANLDGSWRRTLLNSSLTDPRAISVHPGIGYIFFTDWNLQAFIGKIGMDGGNFTKILTFRDEIVWPNALTIDFFSEKIFWADAYRDYIAYADFDGRNKHQVLVGDNVRHVFALSILDDTMYWTDWNLKAVVSAHKFTGADVKVLRNTTRPYDIKVYHPLRQLRYRNPCAIDNGGCSHLCLLAPEKDGKGGATKAACACPDDYVTKDDGRTCILNCSPRMHRCGPPDDVCIPRLNKCDDRKDCTDGSDEHDCPVPQFISSIIEAIENF